MTNYHGGRLVTNKLRTRRLRHDSTSAEEILWQYLRNRQLDGLKFRRQHQYGPYYLDFFCKELNLALEVDGSIHLLPGQMRHDEIKDQYLKDMGLTVLRVRNDLVFEDINEIIERIRALMASETR